MRFNSKFFSHSFDWILLLCVFLLVAMGLAAIYSIDLSRGTGLLFFRKQVLAVSIGTAAFIIASLLQYSLFRSYAKVIYAFSFLLLIAVLFFGTNIRGSRSWFTFNGFSFQPLELAKVGLILMLAYVVYHFGRRFERPLFFIGTGILTLLLMAAIMVARDLGSSLIVGMIWLGIMLLVGARRLHLVILIAAVLVVGVIGWRFLLHEYQRDRLRNFIHPEQNALTTGYNATQAMIAVGAGQWFGRGLGFGSQSQLRFLPEAQTDFIFSVIAEELGFVGVLVLMALFLVMLWRLTRIIRQSSNDFCSVTVSGIAILFLTQMLVNVGANIGLLPITGVTLPFVSYGGSSIVINLFLVGVAESMVERKYV